MDGWMDGCPLPQLVTLLRNHYWVSVKSMFRSKYLYCNLCVSQEYIIVLCIVNSFETYIIKKESANFMSLYVCVHFETTTDLNDSFTIWT